MRTKFALFVSVVLNLALLGWVIFLIQTRSPRVSSPAPTDTIPASRPSAPDSKLTQNPAPGPDGAPPAMPFDWRQVESEDYRRYLANLRAIGCPEKTIKDIITADVNDLFASRRSVLIQSNRYQYWKAVPVTLSEDQKKQLQDLYAQKRDVLKALGVDAPDFAGLFVERPAPSYAENRELQLGFLPESKRQRIKELLFHQAEEEVAAGSGWQERRSEIEQQTRGQIQSLLTSDEFEEYQLRCSREAAILRGVLKEIDPTEAEFRSIFDSWQNLKAYAPGSAEHRDAEAASDSALEQLLGQSRFELYVKGVKPFMYAK